MADRPDGPVLRSARYCLDGRSFGAAINDRVKPHLVRSTFGTDAIEAHSGYGPQTAIKSFPFSTVQVYPFLNTRNSCNEDHAEDSRRNVQQRVPIGRQFPPT
jgi:hypothetical protein